MSASESAVRINLRDFGGKLYVGRPKGELCRAKLKLEELEAAARLIIVVPPDTFAINSSFLLGLIGPSIKKLGSRELFLAKYSFEAAATQWEAFLREAIDEAIGHVLLPNVPLPGKKK